MMAIKCFLIESTDRCYRKLRRYRCSTSKPDSPCPLSPAMPKYPQYAYHDASTPIEDGYARREPWRGDGSPDDWVWRCGPDDKPPKDDPRWPKACACGYFFEDSDEWQLFTDIIYRRVDDGQEMSLRNAPDGAIYEAPWLNKMYAPTPDGRIFMARCPGGHDWCIDSRASNCTMPDDNVHKCWIRHGEPPNFTVDKNGFTCAAGAGSIMAGDYHGFLRNGEFT